MRNKTSHHFVWNGVEVVVKDPPPEDVNVKEVLSLVGRLIPARFIETIDSIYVGIWPDLEDRDLQALYKDGAIFVTNEQSSESDMADDIVHELAHAVEENYTAEIYGDGKLEREFLSKRQKMWILLKDEFAGVPDLHTFMNVEYDKGFDSYLYNDVGYSILNVLTSNIFFSSYGATSLREYFANGFEAYYFHRDIKKIKELSPILFDKINNLL